MEIIQKEIIHVGIIGNVTRFIKNFDKKLDQNNIKYKKDFDLYKCQSCNEKIWNTIYDINQLDEDKFEELLNSQKKYIEPHECECGYHFY